MSGHDLHRTGLSLLSSTRVFRYPAAAGSVGLPGPLQGLLPRAHRIDLRCYLSWCASHSLDPLAVQRPYLELYIRWMRETRRFKPSSVSRRFPVAAGFYRTCVIDGVLDH